MTTLEQGLTERNELTSWSNKPYGRYLLLLVVLVLVVYGNTFNASWHLDDRTNIVDNQNVHVTSLSLNDWSRSMAPPFTNPANREPSLSSLYRPVAMLTFAFNWFLGGADVFGYHLVNIALHCTSCILLFFTCLNLLSSPNLYDRFKENDFFIAFLATALWALHPIQTQAVTYIVQRMAILAALFYLSGIFFYLKGRDAPSFGKKALYIGMGIMSYVLAVGSKQNAITLPMAWLLVEVVFFRVPGFWKKGHVRWVGIGIIAGLAAFFMVVLFYWQTDPFSVILNGYQRRPFTMTQRLLTEFRVVIFYLGQLFYPVPQQFSIMHDWKISTSLFAPYTTLGALVLISTMIAGAIIYVRKMPLMSFAILFFFLGHSVESTIFPLELVFEHRNYLPSLFLFLPVAAGIAYLMDKYRCDNKVIYFMLVSFTALIVLGISLGTHIRNSAWITEKSLWRDALGKAPSLARPYQNLAFALEREWKLDAALRLNQMALELKDPEPELQQFISLSNIGNIYRKKGDFPQAIHYLEKAVKVASGPYKQRVRLNLALCLLNVKDEEEAFKQITVGLRRQKGNIRFLAVKGFILARQEKADEALVIFQQILQRRPYDRDGLVNLATVLSSKGFYQRSEWFFKRAMRQYPDNLIIHLGLLQNALAMKDYQRANQYMSGIAGKFSMDDLKRYLVARNRGYLYINATLVPIDDAIVLPFLIGYLKGQALDLAS